MKRGGGQKKKHDEKRKGVLTLANPSAVPVWVPKKMVTFFFPSSTSSASFFTIKGLSGSIFLPKVFPEEDEEENLHKKRNTHPTNTATDVTRIIFSDSGSVELASSNIALSISSTFAIFFSPLDPIPMLSLYIFLFLDLPSQYRKFGDFPPVKLVVVENPINTRGQSRKRIRINWGRENRGSQKWSPPKKGKNFGSG